MANEHLLPQQVYPESTDFTVHLEACINYMSQGDATGKTLAFVRQNGQLNAMVIDALAIETNNIKHYEMLLFDGGNAHGDSWKHLFFPRAGLHCFLYEDV